MQHINKIKTFLLILFVFVSYQTNAQQTINKVLDDYLSEYIKTKKIPSISAGLLVNKEVKWFNSFGYSDIENNTAVSDKSLFRIASISKPITAVAIMQLWEKGILNLDIDVRKYIPYFPEKKYKFTIRQLLNHTAGIRNYKEGEFDSKKFYQTTREALKVFEYDSLMFEPGTKYSYTSLGYSILAAVIEEVTKKPFENYTNENILLTAGMSATRTDKQREIIPFRMRGYEKNAEYNFINAPLADLSIKVAGGGFLSNSKDLLLFAKALLENKLIDETTLKIMTRKTRLKNGTYVNYGLGFSLEPESDTLKYFGHAGASTGFSGMLIIYPEEKNAAVYLTNIRDINLGEPAKDILTIYSTGTVPVITQTISQELMRTYKTKGIDSTISKLTSIYKYQKELFNFDEDGLIIFSKNLLELNKAPDAIIYLKELLKVFPKSFKVMSALGDAYLSDKNEGMALKYYRNASQINNSDQRINDLIKKLSKK
jgi:CubicO group peptidase (beta-lactamase class C family)